ESCSSCPGDCGVCPDPVYVHGTITTPHGAPAHVQVTTSCSGSVGQQGTDLLGNYKFHLGDVYASGTVQCKVTPSPATGQRLVPAPATASYPPGDTELDFQYCIIQGGKCSPGDLCCDGVSCVDGSCGP